MMSRRDVALAFVTVVQIEQRDFLLGLSPNQAKPQPISKQIFLSSTFFSPYQGKS